MKCLKSIAVNPINEVAGLGVDTGVSGLGTSISPGDNSRQLLSAHEWSTGITLKIVIITKKIEKIYKEQISEKTGYKGLFA